VAAQHRVLVPEHQELGILGRLTPGQHHQAAEQTASEQADHREDHSGMLPARKTAQARPDRVIEPHKLFRGGFGSELLLGSCPLLGTAQALDEAIGAGLPPWVAAARDAPDAETFAAAWARGRTMTGEEALATVQDEAPSELEAARGGGSLSRREVEVLRLVATGLTDAEVAGELILSWRTVHAHLRSMYRKLDVRTRAAATEHWLGHA
jgi:DNA-binding CsgD family transcriptional regulator